MNELDCVCLTKAFEDLDAGTEGTIVHKYNENDFEVEFFDASKETIGVYTISKDCLELTVPYSASTRPSVNRWARLVYNRPHDATPLPFT